MNRLLISGLLIFVVFLAGCAQREGVPTGGTGVIIKSFAPDLTTVDAGSTVTFSLAVKNTGERAATNVKAFFFGLSDDWGVSPAMTPISSIADSLAPADPTTGMTGEEVAFTWDATIDATKGKKTVDVTYDASVRVFYGYTTVSDTFLRFVTNDYVKTNPTVQKGVITSTSTAGPLLITATARTPILSATSTIGRVQFDIQNIGAGRVFDGLTISTGKITSLDNITQIEISGVGTTANAKCAGVVATGGKVVLDGQRLAAGKSKVVSCDVDVSGITNFADRAVKIIVLYSYFVDSAAQVTVSKALQ